MQIRKSDAIIEYMRAAIRAREASSIESWHADALRGAYTFAANTGISFENWCRQMEYELEPEGDELFEHNDAAVSALRNESSPVAISEAVKEPDNDELF